MRNKQTLIIFAIISISLSFNAPVWAGTAALSWNPNTESDLAGYKVYYGTASGAYTQSIDVNNVTSYTMNGLLEGSTYYFGVTAYDTSGNESGFSNEVSKTVLDATAPILSGITASNITGTSAIITWSTNEAATSQVEYGTTTAYGSFSTLNSILVTSNSRTLTGLAPTTTYHYRVISKDAAGNVATSGDNTFTTSAAPDTTPPSISSITASNITSTSATITWSTNEAATSQVEYGTTTTYGLFSTLNSTLVTSHSTTLSSLAFSTTYHYRVRSTDAAGNTATSGDNTFTATTAPDTTPPAISGITTSNITSTGATITWSTNEAATSQVEYGTTTAYGSFSTLNSTLVSSHSRTLSGLAPSTTYHYRVISKDASGNTATSGDNTFTTSAAPDTTPPMDISNFKAEPGDSQVQLTWINPPDPDYMGVRIRYRTDGSFPANPQDGELIGDFPGQPLANSNYVHTGLYNGTTFYYAAFAYDTSGNYSQTVYDQATPQTTASDSENKNPSFGCGTIKDLSGGSGPTATQAVLNLIPFALLFILIKAHRRLLNRRLSGRSTCNGNCNFYKNCSRECSMPMGNFLPLQV